IAGPEDVPLGGRPRLVSPLAATGRRSDQRCHRYTILNIYRPLRYSTSEWLERSTDPQMPSQSPSKWLGALRLSAARMIITRNCQTTNFVLKLGVDPSSKVGGLVRWFPIAT